MDMPSGFVLPPKISLATAQTSGAGARFHRTHSPGAPSSGTAPRKGASAYASYDHETTHRSRTSAFAAACHAQPLSVLGVQYVRLPNLCPHRDIPPLFSGS